MLPLLSLISTIFMSYKTLSFVTNSPTPILVVVSESMSPAFHRGDIVIISNRSAHINVGDIPVVWFPGREMPMVHRAIESFFEIRQHGEGTQGSVGYEGVEAGKRVKLTEGSVVKQKILTKGDNNDVDDRALYPKGKRYVEREEVVGVVRGYLPLLGWTIIALKQSLWVKCAALVVLGLIALLDLSPNPFGEAAMNNTKVKEQRQT